ncbi:hypothetical protein [Variovorax atrisoli]|uniref:hypothetical protein n=1 Tax=Variovorax atrisoli TaxID=3394203 RepID=UPI000BFF788F|nr:hypothetical protein [Variovorax paradoxus]
MKEIATSPRVSWSRLIIDLGRHGYTSGQIAAVVGCGSSTVRDWKNLGSEPEPSHVDGERLIALWCAVTRKPRDEVPLNLNDILSAANFK